MSACMSFFCLQDFRLLDPYLPSLETNCYYDKTRYKIRERESTQPHWLILNPQRQYFSSFLVKINEIIDMLECI